MLTYLHGDHLGSTVLATNEGGSVVGSQGYFAYGRSRSGTGLATDYKFTGQKQDASGLMYFNARYFDPQLGTFISPDTIVPDPSNVFDHNRYMYVRGNPTKYRDPTGHWLETGLDIVSFGFTVEDIRENGLNWENGIGLVADVGSLVLPGVAGGGTIVRHADDAYAAGKAGANAAWDWGKGMLGYGDEAVDGTTDVAKTLDNVPCARNSFSAETLVATETGLEPITEVEQGEWVYAYNEATGEVGLYLVTDELAHLDHKIVTLVIEGERIYTTPEHPFSVNGQWIDAGKLSVGDLVRRLDGSAGAVEAVTMQERPQVMYNLTVDRAHTFFVGGGQWLVHNCSFLGKAGQDVFNVLTDGQSLTKNEALEAGIAFVGDGYKELDAGVLVSADGTRMFRMTDADILGKHGAGPHVNFEIVQPVKKWNGTTTYKQVDNKHIYFSD